MYSMILAGFVSSNFIQILILKNWYSFLFALNFSFIPDTSVITTQNFVSENHRTPKKSKTVGLSHCSLFSYSRHGSSRSGLQT